MSADLLREAAAKMRERAEAATSGPWFAVSSGVEGAGTVFHDGHVLHNDAEHIASWHPAVALAVADWLEDEAERIPPHATHALTSGGLEISIDAAPAVRLARAYLGRDA